MPSPFVPHLATLKAVQDLTPDVKLFSLEPLDPQVKESFTYKPGQFAFVSAFGVGEAPFGLTSVAARRDGMEFAIRRVGTVSAALHDLEAGATLGLRGPYGNSFPLEDYKGKDLLIIGGGIGFAPLRPVINTVLDPAHRAGFGRVTILNGARSPADLVFKEEFEAWAAAPNTRLELTVDRGDGKWQGRVALIPDVVVELKPAPANAVTIICGPPIMIHFTLIKLKEAGFADGQIVTTLEAKMKCGMGKCARCNVGDRHVCLDGPVFDFAQIKGLLEPF